MKPFFTSAHIKVFIITLVFGCYAKFGLAQTQLGIYQFTGASATCPNTNNNVTSQPANATFSAFTNTNGQCVTSATVFNNDHWNNSTGAYNQFTITPNAGYGLTLTSVAFAH